MEIQIKFRSSLGDIFICATDRAVTGILWKQREDISLTRQNKGKAYLLAQTAKKQTEEYLQGERVDFNFPIQIQGTQFQEKVWKMLMKIPYGKTWTYADLANKIKNPKAVRAVGMANGRNALSIVIPCHRVIGKSGRLTGYAGGVDIKKKLLELEQGKG
jgi:methylated-DNA-[protein]-cysteine S-methyltransferase